MVTVDELLDCLLGPSTADAMLLIFQFWWRKIDAMLTDLTGTSDDFQKADAPNNEKYKTPTTSTLDR